MLAIVWALKQQAKPRACAKIATASGIRWVASPPTSQVRDTKGAECRPTPLVPSIRLEPCKAGARPADCSDCCGGGSAFFGGAPCEPHKDPTNTSQLDNTKPMQQICEAARVPE
eukprot:4363100-Amphidinium_carterae.2